MKKITLNLLISLTLIVAFSTRSYGVIVLTIQEVGVDLVLSASGGYGNLNGLTGSSPGTSVSETTIQPTVRNIMVTQSGFFGVQQYGGFSYVETDPIFTGSPVSSSTANSNTINGGSQMNVSFDSSGTSINTFALGYDFDLFTPITAMNYSGSATWNNTSFSDFGLSPGTFEISWDGGNEGLRITVVPEPSTYGAILAPAVLGLAILRRRR